jgi:hypothetical protein
VGFGESKGFIENGISSLRFGEFHFGKITEDLKRISEDCKRFQKICRDTVCHCLPIIIGFGWYVSRGVFAGKMHTVFLISILHISVLRLYNSIFQKE